MSTDSADSEIPTTIRGTHDHATGETIEVHAGPPAVDLTDDEAAVDLAATSDLVDVTREANPHLDWITP